VRALRAPGRPLAFSVLRMVTFECKGVPGTGSAARCLFTKQA